MLVKSHKKIFETKFVNLFGIQCQNGPKEFTYYAVSRNKDLYLNKANAVNIVAITTNDEVILIREFRPSINNYIIDFPAGLIDDGETPIEAATRELKEETGHILFQAYQSPPLYSSVGLTDEASIIVRGVALGDTGQQTESSEDIQVIVQPINKIADILYNPHNRFSAKCYLELTHLYETSKLR